MISKELEMDYKNTYTIIKRLEKQGIISLQRFVNSAFSHFSKSLNVTNIFMIFHCI